MGKSRVRGYKFIDAPPRADMKKKSPDSAPRLYAWLVDAGFVEPVNTATRGNRPSRSDRGRRSNTRSRRR